MKRMLAVGVVATLLAWTAVASRRVSTQQQPPKPQLTPTTADLERRDQVVTTDDLRILQKADELLKDESVWNRADGRECAFGLARNETRDFGKLTTRQGSLTPEQSRMLYESWL